MSVSVMSDELGEVKYTLKTFVAIILRVIGFLFVTFRLEINETAKQVYFLLYILACSVGHVSMHYPISNDLIGYILLISITSYTYYCYRCITRIQGVL